MKYFVAVQAQSTGAHSKITLHAKLEIRSYNNPWHFQVKKLRAVSKYFSVTLI